MLDLPEMENNPNEYKLDVVILGTVTKHFQLSLVNGVMVAQDLLCCQYSNYTSNLMRITHVCDISTDNGDSLCVECIPTLHLDIEPIIEESINTLWL